MQLFNKNIKIHRGETFSLQFNIRTEDGAPYIISSEFNNPYFLLSISDSIHFEPDRYVKNYWLSLNNIPRFELTRPLELSSIKNGVGNSTPKYNSFVELKNDFVDFGKITGYLNNELVEISQGYCIFYSQSEGYKYWNGDDLVDYSLTFVKTFTKDDTIELVSQNYYYDLLLVSAIHSESSDGELLISVDTSYPLLSNGKIQVVNYVTGGF